MKTTTLSVEATRELDRRAHVEFGIPTILLMESAGRALADIVERSLIPPIASCRVVIIAGIGDNAGDGFVAARYLHHRGTPVHVFLAGRPEDLRGDAAVNFRIISAIGVPVDPLEKIAEHRREWDRRPLVVVDAIVGTGFHPPAKGNVAAAIRAINDLRESHTSSIKVIAADIPSGLSGDDGPAGGDVARADMTVTFACLKPGLVRPESRPLVGRVELVDIGVPEILLRDVAQKSCPVEKND